MLRILADTRWLGPHGIGRFAKEVLARLPDWTSVDVRGKPLSMLDPWRLARAIRRAQADVYFSPGFNPPLGRPAPFVFTIHDLIHLTCPGEVGPTKRIYYELVVKPAALRAFKVLTVSGYSRQQIIEWAHVPEDHVVVVGNAVGPRFTPNGPRHEPGYPYLLHVGNHKPHKNIPRLLQAFSASLSEGFYLVLTGSASGQLNRLINRLHLGGRIMFSGLHDDDELAAYYRGATAVILPSTCEGFGLPLIEAMACGTPVVASNAASLPEVAGEAAVLVDPYDVDSIASAMRRIVEDAQLRATLSDRGLQRASAFTWEGTASMVAAVLEEAAE